MGAAVGGGRDGDEVGAVDQGVRVVAEDGELGHGGFERALQLILVV